MPSAAIDRPRSRSTNWLQPAEVLATEKHRPCGSTCTSRRSFDTTVTMLYHLRGPSLLMRVSALATVREWKKRLEHQAHSRFKRRGGCGLPVATGAVT